MRSPGSAASLSLTAVCVDDDVRCFCARIERAVTAHGFTLSRAFAVARQAWPPEVGSVTGTATLVHCEFAPTTPVPDPIDATPARDTLLGALGFVEVFGITDHASPGWVTPKQG